MSKIDTCLNYRYERLIDGLEAFKAKHHLTNREISKALRMSDHTLSRLIAGDKTVRLPIETVWRLELISKDGEKL